MNRLQLALLTGLAVFLLISISGISSQDSAEGFYQTGASSRDGIGKFYMGREIAHVMGHRGGE